MEQLVLAGQCLYAMMYEKHNSFPHGVTSTVKATEVKRHYNYFLEEPLLEESPRGYGRPDMGLLPRLE